MPLADYAAGKSPLDVNRWAKDKRLFLSDCKDKYMQEVPSANAQAPDPPEHSTADEAGKTRVSAQTRQHADGHHKSSPTRTTHHQGQPAKHERPAVADAQQRLPQCRKPAAVDGPTGREARDDMPAGGHPGGQRQPQQPRSGHSAPTSAAREPGTSLAKSAQKNSRKRPAGGGSLSSSFH